MRRWRVEKISEVMFSTERLLGYGIGKLYARQQSTKQFHTCLTGRPCVVGGLIVALYVCNDPPRTS